MTAGLADGQDAADSQPLSSLDAGAAALHPSEITEEIASSAEPQRIPLDHGEQAMNDEERELWRIGDVHCVMVSCCSGAELQLRRDDQLLLRELYPSKADLYERANDLRSEHESVLNSWHGS